MARFKVNLKMLDWLIYRDELASRRLKESLGTHDALEQVDSVATTDMETLMEHLCEDSEHARHEMSALLSTLDEDTAAAILVRQLECNNLTVRWAAMNNMIDRGRTSVRPLLEALTRDMHSSNLREGAHHVLQALKHQGVLHPAEDHVLHALDKHMPALEVAQKANSALINAF